MRLGTSPIGRIFIFLVGTFFLEFCSVEWVILLELKTQENSVNKQKSATTTVTQPSLAGAKKGTKQVHYIKCLNTTTTTQFLKTD